MPLQDYNQETLNIISRHKVYLKIYCDQKNIDAYIYADLENHYVPFLRVLLISRKIEISAIVKIHMYGFRQMFFAETGKHISKQNIHLGKESVKEERQKRKEEGLVQEKKPRTVMKPDQVKEFINLYLDQNTLKDPMKIELAALVSLLSATGIRLKSSLLITLEDIRRFFCVGGKTYLELFISHWKTTTVRESSKMKTIVANLEQPQCILNLLDKHLQMNHNISLEDVSERNYSNLKKSPYLSIDPCMLIKMRNSWSRRICKAFKDIGKGYFSAHSIRRGSASRGDQNGSNSHTQIPSRKIAIGAAGWTRKSFTSNLYIEKRQETEKQ